MKYRYYKNTNKTVMHPGKLGIWGKINKNNHI